MAVIGIDGFAGHFAGYEDCYTVIGGAACEILMSQTHMEFRATKDIDMIILFEDKFKEFAELFWDYVKAAVILLDGRTAMNRTFTGSRIQRRAIRNR